MAAGPSAEEEGGGAGSESAESEAHRWLRFRREVDRLFFHSLLTGKESSCPMPRQWLNGVDVARLKERSRTFDERPALAKLQFRASNRWVSGGYNRSSIEGFYSAGQEESSRTQPFVLEADEPPVLLGEDRAVNPAEYLLHALAACLTTSMVYHAAARGIVIESLESHIEGDLDIRGFLGIAPGVRPGYEGIRVSFKVKSNASPEQLRDLCDYSPVHDIVSNRVPVTISVTPA